jgi:ERCC4-related helicase
MESKDILRLYYSIKYEYLKNNPYYCLFNSDIDVNPHQIEAFMFGLKKLYSGGAVLADEVGLGKTIEAALIIKNLLLSGKDKILLIVPASLRKQWQVELEEKFQITSLILDGSIYDNYENVPENPFKLINRGILICSYQYAAKNARYIENMLWDMFVFDEAHKLRNIHHSGSKVAKIIFDVTAGAPKILLTATPVQNNLYDLYGIIQFIDEKIFFSKKAFTERYVDSQDYNALKKQISGVLKRTLRRDVKDYINFTQRDCITVDFELSPVEAVLYQMVNQYLKKEILFAIPEANRSLLTMVIRKLMASSSYAISETFEVLKKRLEILKESTAKVSVNESLDFFFNFLEEDDDIEVDTEKVSVPGVFDKEQVNEFIQHEIDEVDEIIRISSSIKENSKGRALLKALNQGFEIQNKNGIPEKVVVFTESVRTQVYLLQLLDDNGYEDEVLIFNGQNLDERSKYIYKAWKAKNYGKIFSSRSVEIKHAIVDYFKTNCKILLLTDAGSEGLNLQFCNIVINYDLPWNPQKIEQRIGRCHRYGQKDDVLVINLLNTQNVADKRVYEILTEKFNLFNGVFGSSDEALGLLESGQSFERRVLEIYQKCNSVGEFNTEFKKLYGIFERKKDRKVNELKNLLNYIEEKELENSYKEIFDEIKHYNNELIQCKENTGHGKQINTLYKAKLYTRINNLAVGYIITGRIIGNGKIIKPLLLLYDNENGIIVDEKKIISIIKEIKYFGNFIPGEEENELIKQIKEEMHKDFLFNYYIEKEPYIKYEQEKVENWKVLKKDSYIKSFEEIEAEIESLKEQSKSEFDFKEKMEIAKKIKGLKDKRDSMTASYHEGIQKIDIEGDELLKEFEEKLHISPKVEILSIIKYTTGE